MRGATDHRQEYAGTLAAKQRLAATYDVKLEAIEIVIRG